jgi:aspartyl protease family protein
MLWLLLLIVFLGGIVLLALGDTGTLFGFDQTTLFGLVTGFALLLWVGGSLAGAYRGRLGQAARDIAIWLGLILVLVAGYGFRDELSFIGRRVAGELMPAGEAVSVETSKRGETSIRIRKRMDGHFVARMDVNGAKVAMLVDTGATTVTLTAADARAVGLDVDRLSFTIPVQTANGTGYRAAVRLKAVSIGPIRFDSVEAMIAPAGALNQSLLGMSFLKRLRSYEFAGDFLTLRG